MVTSELKERIKRELEGAKSFDEMIERIINFINKFFKDRSVNK
jgi:hypothetical protein